MTTLDLAARLVDRVLAVLEQYTKDGTVALSDVDETHADAMLDACLIQVAEFLMEAHRLAGTAGPEGVFLRLRRHGPDGPALAVNLWDMTDEELDGLDPMMDAQRPDIAWNWAKALARWLRDHRVGTRNAHQEEDEHGHENLDVCR